ncbi:hypothetical protein GPECTOR_63g66 [Gonium pectorale]|uniref:AB hydrolase-1 domain-containing protein n=1 Tax=Gonium pectorale TaxID=33097 RepID=A0A150G4J2_GONPE|nr:hypothetical protein GPECTOR_63g66 [Gonium pectorale]|eukprot:KXZ44741.1 hypothetical protein GPECTOR_63g66 [Gonium pectorale]
MELQLVGLGVDATAEDAMARAELLVNKLLDPTEGHVPLLTGGHLLAQWFQGLAGPHELSVSHVAQLLAYLLLPPPQQRDAPLPPPSSARLFAASSDPLVASYRPLSFYLLTETVAAATHLALRLLGFRMAGVTPGGAATVYEWTPRRAKSAAAAAANANTEAEPDSLPEPPLVFLHGIGLGLTPYLRLLGRLVVASRGQRAVYAVQYKHVSMRLTANIPAPHEVAADVAVFLAARGVRSVSLLAHSYGTLVASALTKLAAASPAAPAIARLTLVDPVCFAMFLPHLVRNTIYQQPVAPAAASVRVLSAPPQAALPKSPPPLSASRNVTVACQDNSAAEPCWGLSVEPSNEGAQPTEAQALAVSASVPPAEVVTSHAPSDPVSGSRAAPRKGPIAAAAALRRNLVRNLLRGLVVAEFHCSVALRRRLDWARVNLWPSELPPDCTVVLSGRDNLVPVREVAAILANRAAMVGPAAHHPTVLLREDLGHGGFLGDAACQQQVLAAALGCSTEEVRAALEEAEAARRRRRRGSGRRGRRRRG